MLELLLNLQYLTYIHLHYLTYLYLGESARLRLAASQTAEFKKVLTGPDSPILRSTACEQLIVNLPITYLQIINLREQHRMNKNYLTIYNASY